MLFIRLPDGNAAGKVVIDFYIDEPTVGAVADRPLVSRLLAVPSYLETYHGYLKELVNDPFSLEVMEAKIDELANMIRPYVEADTLKFYSTEEFEKGLGEDVATSTRMTGMGMNIGLKAFVAQRVESINKQQRERQIEQAKHKVEEDVSVFMIFFCSPNHAAKQDTLSII